MQIWRTPGQKNAGGPRLENIVLGDLCIQTPKARQTAYNISK